MILAGGRSRRYGSMKAFATVGGIPLVRRAHTALAAVVDEVVAVGGDPRLQQSGLTVRPDLLPGAGPLGGLQTALAWAMERDREGVLLTGCDMPFISSGLLSHLLDCAGEGDLRIVVPTGRAPDKPEPLCAWYSTELLPEVQGRLHRGDLALLDLLSLPGVRVIPPEQVLHFGDPATIFLNVNTPADHLRAERLLLEWRS